MRRAVLAFAALLATPAAAQPVAQFDWFAYHGADPVDEQVKQPPDSYRNPILSGFYPDPSITRVGDDYYLVNSTFSFFPGLPIFHSRDLVSWTQIGNAINRPGQVDFGKLGLSRGIFAPDISWHDGLFYLVTTCVDCGGNFVITAKDPAGPWSDPVWLDIDGIDPSLFFDEDGSAWILNNGAPEGAPRYDGHRAIWIQRFDIVKKKPFGPRKVLVDGGVNPAEKPIWAEGPHIFRKDGHYYLITAEGGTAENHSQVVWRSDKADGPYAPGPRNPILTQRDLDPARPFPVTSAGHADFVATPGGDWWATFLATRPYRDDHYNIGRETFLLPVRWKDGWPEMTAPGEVIQQVHKRPALPAELPPAIPTSGIFGMRHEFDGGPLGPDWLMIRTPRESWQEIKSGALNLRARPVPLGGDGQPSFVARRQQHHWASASTAVRFNPAAPGDRAGIAVLQGEEHFYALSLGLDGGRKSVRLERRAGKDDPVDGTVIASAPIVLADGGPLELRIDARRDHYDFLYAERPGEWRVLARDVDGTLLSTKTAGGFIGAVIGMFARTGS